MENENPPQTEETPNETQEGSAAIAQALVNGLQKAVEGLEQEGCDKSFHPIGHFDQGDHIISIMILAIKKPKEPKEPGLIIVPGGNDDIRS